MNSTAYGTVLFDLDGTLADTVPLITASFERTTSQVLGWTATPDQCRQWIGRSLRETFIELAPDRVDELMAQYLDWNLANHAAYVRSFAGVDELIDDLESSGRNFGVATSKRRSSALVSLECAGLAGRIALLATEEDTVRHKPSPDPLLHALARLDADPGDAAYVGDAVVDLQAAHAAGVTPIAVTWGAATEDELAAAEPAAIARSVSELRQLLAL
ncbi:HAD family hydrolase [Micropruina sp.]|uniref:HAD family hydrolase n=1 Tax=Micropruina sp. TaxID=2737536 RepID=UPI0039E23FC9